MQFAAVSDPISEHNLNLIAKIIRIASQKWLMCNSDKKGAALNSFLHDTLD